MRTYKCFKTDRRIIREFQRACSGKVYGTFMIDSNIFLNIGRDKIMLRTDDESFSMQYNDKKTSLSENEGLYTLSVSFINEDNEMTFELQEKRKKGLSEKDVAEFNEEAHMIRKSVDEYIAGGMLIKDFEDFEINVTTILEKMMSIYERSFETE